MNFAHKVILFIFEIQSFLIGINFLISYSLFPISYLKPKSIPVECALKTKYPDTKLVFAGMQIPPSMGQAYTTEFKNIFTELAEKNAMTLIPFLLEGVGGESHLNQQDGIHPTAEGHLIVAENVWMQLEKLL